MAITALSPPLLSGKHPSCPFEPADGYKDENFADTLVNLVTLYGSPGKAEMNLKITRAKRSLYPNEAKIILSSDHST